MENSSAKDRFQFLSPFLDERMRRLFAAAEAKSLGYGGVSAVSEATGISRRAITLGLSELSDPAESVPVVRVRKPGGGRKRTTAKNPDLKRDLSAIINPDASPDFPMPIVWTCKSVRKLADELKACGHIASHQLVSDLLKELGFTLLGNPKAAELGVHPDRSAQFAYINDLIRSFQFEKDPVVSLETKKNHLGGLMKTGGFDLCDQGRSGQLCVHNCVTPDLCEVSSPLGSEASNLPGWGTVGIDKDTAVFAVNTISSWWHAMGNSSETTRLLIVVDGGGSNSYRVRLWKSEIQRIANETGLSITVCHLPPGTYKWSRIEHRLFSLITQCRKGKPLVSYEVIINKISTISTRPMVNAKRPFTGFSLNKYDVPSAGESKLNLRAHNFHGEWNYTIRPITASHDKLIS